MSDDLVDTPSVFSSERTAAVRRQHSLFSETSTLAEPAPTWLPETGGHDRWKPRNIPRWASQPMQTRISLVSITVRTKLWALLDRLSRRLEPFKTWCYEHNGWAQFGIRGVLFLACMPIGWWQTGGDYLNPGLLILGGIGTGCILIGFLIWCWVGWSAPLTDPQQEGVVGEHVV